MNTDALIMHSFYQQMIEDTKPFLKGVKVSDKYIVDKNENDMSDSEHYIRYTSFYSVHLFGLCCQLERAVKLLSNFRDDNKNEIGRGYHLSYNIENYFIRLDSLYDRILQLVNAIFNFGFDDSKVKKDKVLKKISEVDGYSELMNSLYELNNVLKKYSDEKRNIIVHRYSYFDKELDMIEMFYDPIYSKIILQNTDNVENFKQIRKERLSFYLRKKKKEFNEINEECFEKLFLILNEIEKEYTLKKQELSF
ncbi:hypothetical protein GCM10008015_01770 [Flavobacterium palustre]|uniref:Cthe-2314-like HEPN domain-containing protein n=1 Tax=Flavobacterium palustre TaxID=1476463 RepID=A0ABQ1H992_9FLAO|nr:Cthe_2314 family HEPN domain-containing protein [Flavobacterium palustre]GGA64534.1 hypothetical protein GCM10008015_01770 [Flavobacterium palustre]